MSKRIWKIELTDNGFYKVTNKKTKKYWLLIIQEFIYYSSHFNEIVDSFPNYIHSKIWKMDEQRRKT